ncbi:MAG: virulence RhuM family protein [Bacteroidales bacterium]|nr:virulence RhuM family protein [Bacteroidales bacterium]
MESITNTESSGEIVIYITPDGTTSLDVRFEKDSVWLTQDQLTELFQRDKSVISRHIRDIFIEGELDPKVVVAKNAITTRHGAIADKTQTHEKLFYNLDVIISVGYRVKSKRGTQFRIWANSVLKEYLIKGYAINPRLEQLERRVAKTEEKIDFFVKTSLPPVEGIFFDGQIYDAYEFICNLIKSAKTRIVLIDNYVDDTVLTMLDKRETEVSATIYTQKISPQFKLDNAKHNAQYPAIDVKEFKKSHDRFLILDNQVYLIGASLKDLGKKWFAVSLMSETDPDLLLSRM